MSIEPGAIVMRNGRYGYQARIVRGDYAAKREFTAYRLSVLFAAFGRSWA